MAIYGIGLDLIRVDRLRQASVRWGERFQKRVFTETGAVPQFGPLSITNGYWVAGTKYGRMYDVLPDGSALLMMPAETFGRELRLVFGFDKVIRRKLGRK